VTKKERQFNGERTVFSTNDGAGTARLHMKKEESRCRPYTLHKN